MIAAPAGVKVLVATKPVDFRNYANCTNMLSLQSSAEYYRCSSICWSELFDHLPNIILRFPSTPPLAQVGEAI